MSSITVVTNRHLCREDFLLRIERLLDAGIDRLILREKDLTEDAYLQLAEKVMRLCGSYNTECTLHTFARAAEKVGCRSIHLPLNILRELEHHHTWRTVGTSVHSQEEAREAIACGADHLVAGHIFATDCKKGLAGRGSEWLRMICASAKVPVHAIGGITAEHIAMIRDTGIAGICIMSSAMQTDDVSDMLSRLRENMV